MTSPPLEFDRGDFERLLDEHQRLISLVNDVDFHLHVLAGSAEDESLQPLIQSAGTLVRQMRNYLFRQDQQILPIVEAYSQRQETPAQ